MPVHDDLGKRMKGYEYVTRNYLTRRTPVIIRVDGRAFHTFTRGFERPFDHVLIHAMQQTMQYLCENIQGCVLGYHQSDEISLVLIDYKKLDSAAWFDYNIQKCVSVAASMATLAFNQQFRAARTKWVLDAISRYGELSSERRAYTTRLLDAIDRGAMFDARVFNLPKEEVCNYLYWRQLDAMRNSVQMLGQSYFNHRELQGKSCDQIQEMLFSKHSINWSAYQTHLKRGSCCTRVQSAENPVRFQWTIDSEIPIFSGEGRAYVEALVVNHGT